MFHHYYALSSYALACALLSLLPDGNTAAHLPFSQPRPRRKKRSIAAHPSRISDAFQRLKGKAAMLIVTACGKAVS